MRSFEKLIEILKILGTHKEMLSDTLVKTLVNEAMLMYITSRNNEYPMLNGKTPLDELLSGKKSP
jgi:hypothetical protein